VPINDIKVFRKDLLIATQGRSFWIMDNLTPLHQAGVQVASARSNSVATMPTMEVSSNATIYKLTTSLFKPRDAYRMRYVGGGGFGRGRGPAAPQYPAPGAMIDYFLGQSPAGPVTLDVLDSAGAVIRTFTNEGARAQTNAGAGAGMPGAGTGNAAAAEEEDDFPRRFRGPARLPVDVGLDRFTWDLTVPGPRDGSGQPGGNGPMVAPGRYTLRMNVAGQTLTQPLVVRMDPRVTKDGVTLADVRDQFEHNMRVRDLVSEANRAATRLREARTRLRDATGAAADTARQLRAIEARLLTPPIRYSTPGLQAHIQYLYSMTLDADQRVGRDAKERYAVLRRDLDALVAELNGILGPDTTRAPAVGTAP